jgi:hypothetical protein
MSIEKKQGSKSEQLIAQAEKEGRSAAWDYLNDTGGCTDSENPYCGIHELAEAWLKGYSDCENDYYFEQDNPDMYYDEDEEYYQDYIEREW